MKYLIAFALAIPLIAEDAKPLATVEELTSKVAEQQKENAAKDQTIAYLQRKLQMYQQGLFACQDAQIGNKSLDSPSPNPYN